MQTINIKKIITQICSPCEWSYLFLTLKIEKDYAFFHLFLFRWLKNVKQIEEIKQIAVKQLTVGTGRHTSFKAATNRGNRNEF